MSKIVEFDDAAIEELKAGKEIIIILGHLKCKVVPFTIEDEIADEFDLPEVVFKSDLRERRN